MFHDSGHAAVGAADDSPVAGGVFHLCRHHACRGPRIPVKLQEPAQGRSGEERRIAAQNHQVGSGRFERRAAAPQRVACAQRLILTDKLKALSPHRPEDTAQRGHHRLGLIAHDDEDRFRRKFPRRAHGVLDQRASPGGVQQLGLLGPEPGPLARRQDGDRKGCVHPAILPDSRRVMREERSLVDTSHGKLAAAICRGFVNSGKAHGEPAPPALPVPSGAEGSRVEGIHPSPRLVIICSMERQDQEHRRPAWLQA